MSDTNDGGDSGMAAPENAAESQAASDYITEEISKGDVSFEKPSWAKDIPDASSHKRDSGSGGGKSGCYLSSACLEAAGLPDDCKELTVLRKFRDRFIAKLPDGPALIAEYYATAPGMVARIHSSPNRTKILNDILGDVRCSVRLVQNGRYAAALDLYRQMVKRVSTAVEAENNL